MMSFLRQKSFRPLVCLTFLLLATTPVVSGAEMSVAKTGNEAGTPTVSIEIRPIDDPRTLEVIQTVQSRVEELRGIRLGGPIESRYLDSAALRAAASFQAPG